MRTWKKDRAIRDHLEARAVISTVTEILRLRAALSQLHREKTQLRVTLGSARAWIETTARADDALAQFILKNCDEALGYTRK